jgi:Bacterial pre-peptidase C-terminal domain
MNRKRGFRMWHRWLIVAGLVAALAATGCSNDTGSNTVAPPPPPTGDGNDFTPQSLGTLGTTDIVTNGEETDDADVDLYSVTVTGTTNLFASLNWSNSADLGMALSNKNGITVENVDTDSKPEECILGAVPAGTYTVRVSSRTATATSYTLTIGAR